MNQDDDDRSERSWRLFTFEDMIDGYKSLKRRKRGMKMNKDGRSSSNNQTPSTSPSTTRQTCYKSLKRRKRGMKMNKDGRSSSNNQTPSTSPSTTRQTFTTIICGNHLEDIEIMFFGVEVAHSPIASNLHFKLLAHCPIQRVSPITNSPTASFHRLQWLSVLNLIRNQNLVEKLGSIEGACTNTQNMSKPRLQSNTLPDILRKTYLTKWSKMKGFLRRRKLSSQHQINVLHAEYNRVNENGEPLGAAKYGQ
ncbi:hypothetical protein ACET3Z_030818 [Daucus carota]